MSRKQNKLSKSKSTDPKAIELARRESLELKGEIFLAEMIDEGADAIDLANFLEFANDFAIAMQIDELSQVALDLAPIALASNSPKLQSMVETLRDLKRGLTFHQSAGFREVRERENSKRPQPQYKPFSFESLEQLTAKEVESFSLSRAIRKKIGASSEK